MFRSTVALLCFAFLVSSCTTPDTVNNQEFKSHFPNEDYFNHRNYPEKTFDHKSYFKQINDIKNNPSLRSFDGEWVDQGPGNIGARINKIAINPNNENEIYLGYARGGLYKTTDGGQTWNDIFKEFSYLSISHIEIDPFDTNTIYIGTGDENISHYPAIGNGVYKSTDGGATWENIGLSETAIISKVTVSQQDQNTIYASSMGIPFEKTDDRGMYKSIDGGESWDQILFVNDSTGIIDMVVAPGNSDIVYAAAWNRIRNNNVSQVSGPDAKIWKTIDGGANWTIMETGLPEGEFVRIGLAMHGDSGDTVFASYSAFGPNDLCDSNGINFYGLYKTTDGGDSWNLMEDSTNSLSCDFTGGFAWYFSKLSVNPENVDDICLAGVTMHRRDPDNGEWRNMVWGVSQGDTPHVDFHDMVYFGDNLYAATDGGAYRYNEEEGWVDIENIPTNQFYRVEYNNHEPDLYFGGLQDNGVVGGSGADFNNWFRISGGDGFQLRFDPEDPNYVYTQSQNGNIRVSTNGGTSFNGFTQGLTGDRNWDMQYILSPHNPKIRYTGTNRMFIHVGDVSDDEWVLISEQDLTDAEEDPEGFYEHNITSLNQSPINPGRLYCGTSDGFVWRLNDSGDGFIQINEGLPRRWISEVKASPTSEDVVFVTVSGYKNNDFVPHIYRSDDAGENWIDISGDLPNFAINDVLILPESNDQYIFIATEIGIYMTMNGGTNWERLGTDFPFIQCLDLEYNDVNNQLVAGTYGKGLRTFDLDQIIDVSTEEVTVSNLFSIAPNVSSDQVNIITQGKYQSARVMDSNGKLVRQLKDGESIIDITQLEAGTYFIQVRLDHKIQVEKFIKI